MDLSDNDNDTTDSRVAAEDGVDEESADEE
jgi:hypothetical protein